MRGTSERHTNKYSTTDNNTCRKKKKTLNYSSGHSKETSKTTNSSEENPTTRPSSMFPERTNARTVEGGAAAKGRATRHPANAETNATPSGYTIKLFTFAHNGG